VSIRVQVNGESQELPEGTTVLRLLALLDVRAPRVAVEVDAQVIPRAQHEQTVLAQGNQIEIVTFVGGG
jgi:sulfur carrier protein